MAARNVSSQRHATWIGMIGAALIFVPWTAVSAFEDGKSKPSGRDVQPVVLELFTSQGCSSCPPADALLRELGERDDIIALSFHVDYWNRLGWEDPYSDRQWSLRQEQYVKALRGDTLYTPQVVVNGTADVVGSDARKLGELIRIQRKLSPAQAISVRAQPNREGATVQITTSDLERDQESRPLELQIFVAENGIETSVRSGENARRKLRHDHVVRDTRRVRDWQGSPTDFQLELEDDWNVEHLELVVLVQDTKTRHVVAVAHQAWPQEL